jgi:hypothetical protein
MRVVLIYKVIVHSSVRRVRIFLGLCGFIWDLFVIFIIVINVKDGDYENGLVVQTYIHSLQRH